MLCFAVFKSNIAKKHEMPDFDFQQRVILFLFFESDKILINTADGHHAVYQGLGFDITGPTVKI